MNRVVILLAIILNWNVGFAQIEIDIPNFEFVQVDYDLKDYVSISLDRTGQIKVGIKEITLEALRTNLFIELSRKAKFEGLRLPISIIELIVDKELEFQKLELLLTELRKNDFLKIHFVCNSDIEKRTEGLKTTGFLYKLNSVKNSNSIQFEVRDSLNVEMKRIMKARGGNVEEFKKSQIPPPPASPEITAEKLINGEINIEVKVIEITNEFFFVENQKFNSKELRNQMTKWNSIEPIAYILKPNPNCKYEKFLTPIVEFKKVLKLLWEEESIKTFDNKYESLNYRDKTIVRNRYPFIMVIDE